MLEKIKKALVELGYGKQSEEWVKKHESLISDKSAGLVNLDENGLAEYLATQIASAEGWPTAESNVEETEESFDGSFEEDDDDEDLPGGEFEGDEVA